MKTITHTIQVDSRDRDSSQSANNYSMYLTEPIKHIREVIIRDIQVPNSTYNVVEGKNTMTINGTPIQIAPGSYSGLDLASQIFNITTTQAFVDVTWNVIYDTGTKKFIFTQAPAFTINFNINDADLADTLGFDITATITINSTAGVTPYYYAQDITLQNNWLPSERVANLVKDKYFYLSIEEFLDPRVQTAKRAGASGFTGNNLSRIFGKVPVYAGPGNDVYFDRNSSYKLVRSYISSLTSVSRLTIRWIDYKGDLINFNGLNSNSFTLELVCDNRT